ncbi:type II toxin-antitoxin system RelE/ParE family toxin [Methylobacterium sp. D53M]
MPTIRRLPGFDKWLNALRDDRAAARITARIRRLGLGNPGDCKPVGGDVHEMRIDYGPGYRAYFTNRGDELVVLLCGGDKRTQPADIAEALRLSATVPKAAPKVATKPDDDTDDTSPQPGRHR